MSEFSESFHLVSRKTEDAIALLDAAGASGFVFPANGARVSFVCPESANERVIAANTLLLLHYVFAADHLCRVDLYEQAKRVGTLSRSFETKKKPRFDRDAFVAARVMLSTTEVDRWLTGELDEDRNNRYVVAQTLGLARYQWLSYAYEIDGGGEPDPDRITVGDAAKPPSDAAIVLAGMRAKKKR